MLITVPLLWAFPTKASVPIALTTTFLSGAARFAAAESRTQQEFAHLMADREVPTVESPPIPAAVPANESIDATQHRRIEPRVACSGPYRLHVLRNENDKCDCQFQHVIVGRDYNYCTCGHAVKQPWCDGNSCASFSPTVLRVETYQTFILVCGCKRTGHPRGLCDGSHSTKVDAASLEW